ncbi:MAG: hypothetical protein ACT4OS_08230 [Acidimicrobiales bacterium]
MVRRSARSRLVNGLASDVGDLWKMVVGYARQETIAPLRGLGRYLAYGLAGSLVIGIGSVFLVLGLLRALQTQTGSAFVGGWSWAPYLLTVLAAAAAAVGLMARARR